MNTILSRNSKSGTDRQTDRQAESEKAGILGILDTEEHFQESLRLRNIYNESARTFVALCTEIERPTQLTIEF